MEPLLPPEHAKELAELTVAIHREAGKLEGLLRGTENRLELARVVRQMNSYYSNLIEEHRTLPRDIERAQQADFDEDPKARSHQKLGLAHARVEAQIESRFENGLDREELYSLPFLRWIHASFFEDLPAELCISRDHQGREYEITPGELRQHRVDLGHHLPPDCDYLEPFLGRFFEFYGSSRILSTRRIAAIAAAHHRLLWIHPFADGNGRVARLFSHACLIDAEVAGVGLWTLSRGLARNRKRYFAQLSAADRRRDGDLDGRGNLSQKGLSEFCVAFAETLLDQITFMGSLLDLEGLSHRMEDFVFRQNLFGNARDNKGATRILTEALYKGTMPRGRAPELTGKKQTAARLLLHRVVDKGLLKSKGPSSPVHLAFPSSVHEAYFPQLFVELDF
ncbi:MAG: Fic family protein [Opitutales bacterium]